MPIDPTKWERGCCAMTYQRKNAEGNTVLLTRFYGAEQTRVEIYQPDNTQLGEAQMLPNDDAEALVS